MDPLHTNYQHEVSVILSFLCKPSLLVSGKRLLTGCVEKATFPENIRTQILHTLVQIVDATNLYRLVKLIPKPDDSSQWKGSGN